MERIKLYSPIFFFNTGIKIIMIKVLNFQPENILNPISYLCFDTDVSLSLPIPTYYSLIPIIVLLHKEVYTVDHNIYLIPLNIYIWSEILNGNGDHLQKLYLIITLCLLLICNVRQASYSLLDNTFLMFERLVVKKVCNHSGSVQKSCNPFLLLFL